MEVGGAEELFVRDTSFLACIIFITQRLCLNWKEIADASFRVERNIGTEARPRCVHSVVNE